MGSIEDTCYMMYRSLHLILSDLRPKKTKRKISIDFRPEGAPVDKDKIQQPVFFKNLILILNCWASLRSLNDFILPNIEIPYTIAHKTIYIKEEEEEELDGLIDWPMTFQNWAVGNKEIAIKIREKSVATKLISYILYVLTEFKLHGQCIVEYMKSKMEFKNSETLHDILNQMESVIKRIEYCMEKKFSDFPVTKIISNEKIISLVNKTLTDNTLDQNPIFREYILKFKPKLKQKSFLPDFVRNLMLIREQYLSCNIWLAEKLGFSFKQNADKAHLYEFWCFYEFVIAAQEIGFGNAVQNSFINRNRVGPEFKIGKSYFAYFDYRSSRFKKMKAENVFSSKLGLHYTALSNVFVEWFIRDIYSYADSIIIDTKYGRWNSREALKVLGYMANFGIRNGVIIFRFNVPNGIGGEVLTAGLIKITCPTIEDKTLYVMTLIPAEKYSERNRNILRTFIRHRLQQFK